MAAWLQAQGHAVNRKRVQRLMQRMGLAWGNSMRAQLPHQFLLIVTLISAQRDRPQPGMSAAIAKAASGSAMPLA